MYGTKIVIDSQLYGQLYARPNAKRATALAGQPINDNHHCILQMVAGQATVQ